MKKTAHRRTRQSPRRARRGVALLMSLFFVFMVSAMLVNVFQTETLQLAAVRNSIEYEQALYWANAGVHHACAELAVDNAWRGTVSDGDLPPAGSPSGYQTSVVDDGLGGVTITSTGYHGRGARTVAAKIQF